MMSSSRGYCPPVHELAPAWHVAHYVRDMVRKQLDLSAFSFGL